MADKKPMLSAVVIGGGVAGIAAAVRLAQHGVAVTLVETRKRLGGRATSHVDPQSGQLLDNCQHVVLACCTNLLDLYDRLGATDDLQWHRELYFAAPPTPTPQQAAWGDVDGHGQTRHVTGVLDTLVGDHAPAPMHLTRSLLGMRTLTLGDKLAISRAMLAIMKMGRSGRLALEDISFAQWLARERQPESAIRRFWANIVVGACNETLDRVAASYALQVFQEGFLAHEDAYVMGLASVPLVDLYDAAEPVLVGAGGRLLLGVSADAFVWRGRSLRGVRLSNGQTLEADAYISTLPFDRLGKLCDDGMRLVDARLQRLAEIDVSPILGIHLWFRQGVGNANGANRPIMTLPHLVLLDSPIHWIFNKGYDDEVRAEHLHGVVSAAHALVDRPADWIAALADHEVRTFLPRAKGARLVHHRVIKEKRATFSIRPGLDELRPGPRGAIGNLYLAGDWCDTGWPATMEGACRSGYAAATCVLEDAGRDAPPAVLPDLPVAPLYRFVSRALGASDARA